MPLKNIPLHFLMGVNRFDHRRRLKEGEAYTLQNLAPTDSGMLRKRRAALYDRKLASSIEFSGTINRTILSYQVAHADGLVYEDVYLDQFWSTGTAQKLKVALSGSDLVTVNFGQILNWRAAIVPFGWDLYVFPGKRHASYDYAMTVVLPDPTLGGLPSLTSYNFSGTDNGDLNVRTACAYLGRMVYAFRNNGYQDCLVFSDIDTPRTIGNAALVTDAGAKGSRFVRLPDMYGDEIVAMAPIMMSDTNNPSSAALLVLGNHNAFIVTGQLEQTTYTGSNYLGTYNYTRVNFTCGCASAETLVRTPYGTLWASEDDVWLMHGNSLPVRVGTKIREVLQATSPGYRYRWSAAFHDGCYRLLVFDDTQNGGSHDGVLKGEWWLDLREGIPRHWREARWFGPMRIGSVVDYSSELTDLGLYCIASEPRQSKARACYGIVASVNNTANVLGASRVKLDNTESDRDVVWNTSVQTEVRRGHEIRSIIDTPDMDFGDDMVDKINQGIEVNLWNNSDLYLAAEFTSDDGVESDETSATVTASENDEEFRSIIVDPDDDVRITGKTHRMTLNDEPGWIVTDENDAVQFACMPELEILTVNLTHGYYEDVKAYLDHLIAQMTAAAVLAGVAGAFSHNQTAPSNSEQNVTITHDTTKWIYLNDLGSDDEQDAKNVRVWGDLGFDTSVAIPSEEYDFTADDLVVLCPSSRITFASIVLRIYQFFARPRSAQTEE